ncbi:helix-turn-helix transcriptional regulator [Microbacterium testaceum]|uniref:helix-turn-helix transcriptional regulator n=1 Tax=Microbacterium testaceum TaxID=2033 RepID=UPI001D1766B8|nr:helix-turn-helix transcriptional regulator [Microbacterium testaceum]MCC4247542.1 helix-turn-helix transcriptional regulator [Microbacterium testaceum]
MSEASPLLNVKAAGARVAMGVLPIAPAPDPADLRFLADIEAGPAPRLWVDASAQTLEALLIARSRLDRVDDALRLADAHFADGRLRAPGRLSAATRSTLFAAVAEVYAAAGRPRQAGAYASSAIGYADDAVSLYRAHAVRGLAAAINGEYLLARESLRVCEDLASTSGWDAVHPDYDLLLARILVASAALDAETLEATAEELREGAPTDPFWQYSARAAEAMGALTRRNYDEGMVLVATLAGGTGAHSSHTMVRGFAQGVYADLLLARGEPRRSLAVLEGRVSPPGHALCFDMQRAAALIALGREREVLESTDPCIRMGTEHCVRTLTPLLLRRAVAHARLGNDEAADAAFAEGFYLSEGLGGSLTPYLTLPRPELQRLLERLAARHPTSAGAAGRVAGMLAQVPSRDHRPPLPTLSPREERLALALRGPRSLSQIADELDVSPNTVKSQLRSIYAKLQVSGRDAAVAVLEAHGFYV